MSGEERVGFADSVHIIHRDKAGNILHEYDSTKDWRKVHPIGKHIYNIYYWLRHGKKYHNTIVAAGMAEVSGLILTDIGGTAFDYVGIGEGATAPAVGDTDLETPTKRKAGTGTQETTTQTNDTAKLVATFSSADTLSGTDSITETGMFNAASAGDMLFRQTFTAISVDWDAGDTLEMTLKVQVKQGA